MPARAAEGEETLVYRVRSRFGVHTLSKVIVRIRTLPNGVPKSLRRARLRASALDRCALWLDLVFTMIT
jgi:hypothetical protein